MPSSFIIARIFRNPDPGPWLMEEEPAATIRAFLNVQVNDGSAGQVGVVAMALATAR
jgi:hypothetical protein